MNLEEKRCVFKNETGAAMFTVGEKILETERSSTLAPLKTFSLTNTNICHR